MWPAVSLDDVFERAASVTDSADLLGERLVSLVFAPPGARLWQDLRYSVAYLDAQTGNDWDLFFIGVPAVARSDSRYGGDWSRHFQPKKFFKVEREVYRRHANALEAANLDIGLAWHHTGGADLVSVLTHHHGVPDWLSLTACRIDQEGNEPVTLAELASRQREWRGGREDPMFWRDPRRSNQVPGSVHHLEEALRKTAAILGGGVAGNAAYQLVQGLLQR